MGHPPRVVEHAVAALAALVRARIETAEGVLDGREHVADGVQAGAPLLGLGRGHRLSVPTRGGQAGNGADAPLRRRRQQRRARRVPGPVTYAREAMAGVALRGVTKRFGSVVAVDDLYLDVDDREFLVLLGPSGCGKSTVLRMIAGLETPTAGDVLIGDRRVNDVHPKQRDVAMVFQSYALYPAKSVRENIEFPLKARQVDKRQRAEAVREAAALLDLAELLDRRPAQLSGGQRQRVALARAIVRHPVVFLMDEPLSNLDAKLRTQTRAQLIDLHHRLHATFVYVTHDQVEAMTMGTRVAVMHAGVVQQVAAPQEVYDRPANAFVAQFIGSPPMNLFPPGLLEPGDRLVGVRPEHIRLGGDGRLEGKVTLVEALGHERHVTVVLTDDTTVVVRVGADQPVPAEGDSTTVDADDSHRHRFDPASGARVDEP